jgi:hypothetical protein
MCDRVISGSFEAQQLKACRLALRAMENRRPHKKVAKLLRSTMSPGLRAP